MPEDSTEPATRHLFSQPGTIDVEDGAFWAEWLKEIQAKSGNASHEEAETDFTQYGPNPPDPTYYMEHVVPNYDAHSLQRRSGLTNGLLHPRPVRVTMRRSRVFLR